MDEFCPNFIGDPFLASSVLNLGAALICYSDSEWGRIEKITSNLSLALSEKTGV